MDDNNQPQYYGGRQQPPPPPQYGTQQWPDERRESRVNWVAIISFLLPFIGMATIIFDPFDDSQFFAYIGMSLIGLGISGSFVALAFKPRWQAAIGCLPGLAAIFIFLVIGIALGQHHPPRQMEEAPDSTEVVPASVDDSIEYFIANDTLQ